jgi:hypothetical protein
MKPTYSTNSELLCGVIDYGSKQYFVDISDKDKVINFKKSFDFVNDEDVYPSFLSNYQKITLLEFLYKFKTSSVAYYFENGNFRDLRSSNVKIFHPRHQEVVAKYNVVDYNIGHFSSLGVGANVMKNPLWKIQDGEEIYLIMFCEKDTFCKVCLESYQKILDFEKQHYNGNKITWSKHSNGYITGTPKLYIHQVIMNCYGNGRGTNTLSVDHIDQNPLNNTYQNLRIATREQQEQNSKGIKQGTKRERKTSARDLPDGITHDMMKKYVVYYREYYDAEKTKEREYFKIEKHPKLDKIWISSKSEKLSIRQKLDQTNKVVEDLEKDIYPTKEENALPKFFCIRESRGSPHLIFDKKTNDSRYNLRMILPSDYDLETQLFLFKNKLNEKYPDLKL